LTYVWIVEHIAELLTSQSSEARFVFPGSAHPARMAINMVQDGTTTRVLMATDLHAGIAMHGNQNR